MSVDFDLLPVYDPILRNKSDLMSDVWVGSLSTLMDTLISYIGQSGFKTPNLTTEQRDEIKSPLLGQLIYNTSTNELEVWQIKAGISLWRAITTTP